MVLPVGHLSDIPCTVQQLWPEHHDQLIGFVLLPPCGEPGKEGRREGRRQEGR